MQGNGCKMYIVLIIYEIYDLKLFIGDYLGKFRCECYFFGWVCQFWLEVKERFLRKLIMNKILVIKIIFIKIK